MYFVIRETLALPTETAVVVVVAAASEVYARNAPTNTHSPPTPPAPLSWIAYKWTIKSTANTFGDNFFFTVLTRKVGEAKKESQTNVLL